MQIGMYGITVALVRCRSSDAAVLIASELRPTQDFGREHDLERGNESESEMSSIQVQDA